MGDSPTTSWKRRASGAQTSGGGRHSLQDVHLARPEMSISGWSFDYFTGGGTA